MADDSVDQNPELYARFRASITMVVKFTVRERSELSPESGSDVQAALKALHPLAEVTHDVKAVTAKVHLSPSELAGASVLYDKMFSAMFMRVNYGKDAPIIESILAAHPELTALKDLNAVLVQVNALIQTIQDSTKGLEAVAEALNAEQLETLTTDRFGSREDIRLAHEEGAMRGVDPLDTAARLAAAKR